MALQPFANSIIFQCRESGIVILDRCIPLTQNLIPKTKGLLFILGHDNIISDLEVF